jgi:hypothetical protein
LNRTDPVFLNLQKTRLHDPLLDFMGCNNHPATIVRAVAPALPCGLCERSARLRIPLITASMEIKD